MKLPKETLLPTRIDDIQDFETLREYLKQLVRQMEEEHTNVFDDLATNRGRPGIIVMWSGALADIPEGWALCDGAGGRPDFRDKFVLGAPAGVDPGDIGGAHSKALVLANMPAHSHGSAGSHQHSAAGSHQHASIGNHAHNFQVRSAGSSGSRVPSTYSGWSLQGYQSTESGGGHQHTGVGNHQHAAGGGHEHTSQGSGSAFDNRPAFYKVAYIIKT